MTRRKHGEAGREAKPSGSGQALAHTALIWLAGGYGVQRTGAGHETRGRAAQLMPFPERAQCPMSVEGHSRAPWDRSWPTIWPGHRTNTLTALRMLKNKKPTSYTSSKRVTQSAAHVLWAKMWWREGMRFEGYTHMYIFCVSVWADFKYASYGSAAANVAVRPLTSLEYFAENLEISRPPEWS